MRVTESDIPPIANRRIRVSAFALKTVRTIELLHYIRSGYLATSAIRRNLQAIGAANLARTYLYTG